MERDLDIGATLESLLAEVVRGLDIGGDPLISQFVT
jgi:hypothetical protein